ncbi:hypothetical protein EMIT074MI3_11734 [Bacillus licheniformis]
MRKFKSKKVFFTYTELGVFYDTEYDRFRQREQNEGWADSSR